MTTILRLLCDLSDHDVGYHSVEGAGSVVFTSMEGDTGEKLLVTALSLAPERPAGYEAELLKAAVFLEPATGFAKVAPLVKERLMLLLHSEVEGSTYECRNLDVGRVLHGENLITMDSDDEVGDFALRFDCFTKSRYVGSTVTDSFELRHVRALLDRTAEFLLKN